MAQLRVSLAQRATTWHDAAANRSAIAAELASLRGQTDLIVLPETCLSGFSNAALPLAEGMDGPTVPWLQALSSELDAAVTGSFLIKVGTTVFNRMLFVTPDGAVQHYDKRHLFRMANEHERYGAGEQRVIVHWRGFRINLQVCYDLRFPVWCRNQNDFDLQLFVANWPSPRRYAWQTLLRARAIENLAYVVAVNRVGTDGNQLDYAGDSVALDYLGQPLLELGAQPLLASAVLDLDALHAYRARFPAHQDADQFVIQA
jgi:omega-amidase